MTIDESREQLRRTWTDADVVAGWRRWHDPFASASAAMSARLLAAARPTPGAQVLDLAAGTGQLSLDLVGLVGPTGHVTATDLAAGMVAASAEQIARRGVTNATAQVADAHALPFADAAFDLVTSRLGVMFFPDIPRALGEVRRVLRPGGRAAFLVWGARERNPFFTTTLGPLVRHGFLSPPAPGGSGPLPLSAPGAPGPFAFAVPGTLAAALAAVGFAAVTEEEQAITLPWPGPGATFWRFAREVLPSLGPAYARLTPDERATIDAAVGDALAPYETAGLLTLPAVVRVAVGERR